MSPENYFTFSGVPDISGRNLSITTDKQSNMFELRSKCKINKPPDLENQEVQFNSFSGK